MGNSSLALLRLPVHLLQVENTIPADRVAARGILLEFLPRLSQFTPFFPALA